MKNSNYRSDNIINKYLKFSISIFLSVIYCLEEGFYNQIDNYQENNDFKKALQLTIDQYEFEYNKEEVEILWRLARGYFDLADQTSNEEEKKIYINQGLPYAKKALDLSPSSSKANHWYAVLIGQKGILEGTKQKILNSYDVQKYCLKAIEIDPYYDGSLHVMGRWHYNVADLSWLERTIASVVYAAPPKGSFNEAIDYFKRAIGVNPTDIRHYLWLGKSYYAIGEKNKARDILTKSMSLSVSSESDKILREQAKKILDKL